LIQVRGHTSRSEIHKLINPISNKEELPQQGKKYMNARSYEKVGKTDCSNHRRISLLPAAYKIYPIFLSQG